MDETLSWEAHISEVVSKVDKVLATLEEAKTDLSPKFPSHNS